MDGKDGCCTAGWKIKIGPSGRTCSGHLAHLRFSFNTAWCGLVCLRHQNTSFLSAKTKETRTYHDGTGCKGVPRKLCRRPLTLPVSCPAVELRADHLCLDLSAPWDPPPGKAEIKEQEKDKGESPRNVSCGRNRSHFPLTFRPVVCGALELGGRSPKEQESYFQPWSHLDRSPGLASWKPQGCHALQLLVKKSISVWDKSVADFGREVLILRAKTKIFKFLYKQFLYKWHSRYRRDANQLKAEYHHTTPGESWLRINSGLNDGEKSTCTILKVFQLYSFCEQHVNSGILQFYLSSPTGFILMLGCLNLPLFRSQWEEALIRSAQKQTFWNQTTHLQKYWCFQKFFEYQNNFKLLRNVFLSGPPSELLI